MIELRFLRPADIKISFTRFLFLVFPYFSVSVPCARLGWRSRQLLSARKYTVSYRIVSTIAQRTCDASCHIHVTLKWAVHVIMGAGTFQKVVRQGLKNERRRREDRGAERGGSGEGVSPSPAD